MHWGRRYPGYNSDGSLNDYAVPHTNEITSVASADHDLRARRDEAGLEAVADAFDFDLGDFGVGGGFEGFEGGEEGLFAEVVGEGTEVGLVGGGGDGHGDLEGTAGFKGEGNIFFGEGEGEAGVVEATAEQVGHEADEGAGGADFEHAVEFLHVEASFGAEDKAFLGDLAAAEDDGIVDQFDEASGACVAEEEDIFADRFEQGMDAVEGVAVAAGEQGEGAALGTGDAPGDGAVEVEDTAFGFAGG